MKSSEGDMWITFCSLWTRNDGVDENDGSTTILTGQPCYGSGYDVAAQGVRQSGKVQDVGNPPISLHYGGLD
jgi:hypothetical protein